MRIIHAGELLPRVYLSIVRLLSGIRAEIGRKKELTITQPLERRVVCRWLDGY